MRTAWRWPLAGFLLGGLVGMTALTTNVVGATGDGRPPPAVERTLRDLLHSPPLLLRRGEPAELRYEAVCSTDELGTPCELRGRVFVRAGGDTAFSELPLVRERDGATMRAAVPARYLALGAFEYFATVEAADGESLTLPAGGAAAPQRATVVPEWHEVELGRHRFGMPRRPAARVASAVWGTGAAAVGLDSGREQSRIGPSAFDVAADGSVVVLDQVNRRLARYGPEGGRPAHVPIPFTGGEGDLAVASDGTTYVLDEGGTRTSRPVIQALTPAGELVASAPLAARSADMLRIGPGGRPYVHTYPSELWLPTGGRPPLAPREQLARARRGRPTAPGEEIVVRAFPGEARFALLRGDRVHRAWRLTSDTAFGEVQLAEPHGNGLLVVLRVWGETQAEFRVLHLTASGVDAEFTTEAAEWAESAALGRFRLAGGRLYQLRTTPAGAEIVSFDLGGTP